jgi:hypothetical protein
MIQTKMNEPEDGIDTGRLLFVVYYRIKRARRE